MARWTFLAATLLVLGNTSGNAGPPAGSEASQSANVTTARDLRKELMERASALQAAHHGIFREDVTATVLPAFPVGQTMAETEAILARQKLGTLRMFKGQQMPSEGTMYVSTFTLMSGMSSQIYVVLDFDYDGTKPDDMVLRKVKAFIRATNM